LRSKKIYITKDIEGSGPIVGDIEYQHEFYSVNLKNERDIIIWLPPSYNSSFKKYPVLYMHDGQNLFNPQTSFIGHDWKADEVTTYLIKNNLIEEFIIVGINNTAERIEEYNYFTGKGKLYSLFLVSELKNFIDENYRTITGPENTAVMGSSMGGLISFQMLLNYPHIFGKAACMSNSFWVNKGEIFRSLAKYDSNPSDHKIYNDYETAENELIRDNRKMCRALKSIGFETGKNLYCHFAKGGVHSEMDWSRRLHLPLLFLFGKDEKLRADNRKTEIDPSS